MFNTFEPERPNDPPVYGLVSNEETFNQLWLQVNLINFLQILMLQYYFTVSYIKRVDF